MAKFNLSLLIVGMIMLSSFAQVRSDNLSFPDGFLWGTATSGFQVDMGCPTLPPAECNDPNSDWYQWVTNEFIIGKGLASGESVENGPGHWELFDMDFNLSRTVLSNNAYRMSIEWSRIFPESTVGIYGYEKLKSIANVDAIQHYHNVFASMKAHGLTPFVTLNHYSLPLWIHNGVECHKNIKDCTKRGWLDKDLIVTEIAKYAGFVAKEFGAEVDLWATLNEPFAVALTGYILPFKKYRTNPPGIIDLTMEKGINVIFNMIDAHVKMYDAIKENDLFDANGDGRKSLVGIVHNMTPFKPAIPKSKLATTAAENANYVHNLMLLNALIKGEYDNNLDGISDKIRDDWKNKLDFVGINYYLGIYVIGLKNSLNSNYQKLTFLPVNILKDYPEGLYEMIKIATSYEVPIYITENGAWDDPEGEKIAPSFLVNHLYWVWKAINEGANVQGYFWWSYIDTYEWNLGTTHFKMGMFSYEPKTKQRKAKFNASVYSDIARQNRLPKELIDKYKYIK